MNAQTDTPKTYGGFIGLQLIEAEPYHQNLLALNTGRNALEYILRVRGYRLIYLPYYTCEVLIEPLKRLNIQHRFYKIDINLEPIIDFEIEDDACLLYTNYFGVKTDVVTRLSHSIKNIIIDNAQAFFNQPIANCDTFYSCRKFFGVPDGAYLYIDTTHHLELQQDLSIDRFSHLIKSVDINIETGYKDYIENNRVLENNEIKKMSRLTQSILSAIDYSRCIEARKRNFQYLHQNLASLNLLNFELSPNDVPMVYPLLLNHPGLREKLIERNVYIPTYWPNVLQWASEDSTEHFLTKNLIAIPIDHRYGIADMKAILEVLNSIL
ncbi:hypothetical protein [Pedobacter sandarakinus]|uniref:hypothetical protein n=1 Tax=Pedobacter sandarakinus TaxID=353156 RepID=UPI002246BE91|nr:hypothetical protein [Pedobacter sandarakinus]MCX2574311.1 hypothetical protein [Pedobacter sandarakinus]